MGDTNRVALTFWAEKGNIGFSATPQRMMLVELFELAEKADNQKNIQLNLTP